jgi:hypothetical protein
MKEEPNFRRASEITNRSNLFATLSLPVLKFLQVGESFRGSIFTNMAFYKKEEKNPLCLSALG